MSKRRKTIIIDGEHLTLSDLPRIAAGHPIKIGAQAKQKIIRSRKLVEKQLKTGKPFYGINTGFGYFANTTVAHHELQELQRNILLSHACGYGDPLSEEETRLAMTLRLNVLTKGFTGVRYELCQALLNLIDAGIYPIIPEYGSVGASGDLVPLAHLALPLIGEGMVRYEGKTILAKTALKKAGLSPIALEEKEGLSLVNGTQIMLAVGGLALVEAMRVAEVATAVAALSFEGLEGCIDALDLRLHEARGQKGQIDVARRMVMHLRGSHLHTRKTSHGRVQDPYSLRCVPQIHGPSFDALGHAATMIERELNAATDNPLLFVDTPHIVSGGNFHGQALAMAFDIACLALAELGNVSERRLELLLNPSFSKQPAFLSPKDGLCSGYMASQYLSASLVNQNKLLANPAVTDSIPGNVGVEDHVSMGMTSARKLKKLTENVLTILAAEAVAAAQAIDLKGFKPRRLGTETRKLYSRIREEVPPVLQDRIIATDISKARAVLQP